MSVTIKDVARMAGVSVATVSRVLNESAPVLEVTRTRVLKAARELRFIPNGAARALSRQRAATIGAILPDLYGEFFSELLRGMDQQAQRADHALLVSSSHHDSRGMSAAIRAMRGRVDGLLVMAPEVPSAQLAELLPGGLPTVLLNGASLDADVHAVSVDNFGGAREMTRHLFALGHRRIGFLCGAASNADAGERERGHLAALEEEGVPLEEELRVRGDFTETSGWSGAGTLLDLATPPTAIFAANDAMAIGALSALREARVDVPSQMTVVGFDDIPVARFLSPPLTSVRVGIAELGTRAMDVLLRALAERPPPGASPRRILLPTQLVVRGSCGPPVGVPLARSRSLKPSRHP